MRKVVVVLAVFLAVFFVSAPSYSPAQQGSQKEKPDARKDGPGRDAQTGKDAHSGMTARGESTKGMGFSQTATVHHFLLKPDGGVIQVEARMASDTSTRDMVRMHLTHITHEFSQGNFAIPMFVHDAIPPGTASMKRLREKIEFTYEDTAGGARIVIKAADPSALDAVHDFLRYQIREHQTGDPDIVPEKAS